MELKYVKLLKDNNLQESSLSGKVLVGIKEIKNTVRGVELTTRNGRKVAPATIEKLEWLDEMVSNIIQSTVDAKSSGSTDAEKKAAEEQKRKEEAELTAKIEEQKRLDAKANSSDEPKPVKGDPKADQIDADCEKALKDGKDKVKLADLKSVSKTAYDVIFDTYKEGDENGVQTSNYSVIETEKELFTISKL